MSYFPKQSISHVHFLQMWVLCFEEGNIQYSHFCLHIVNLLVLSADPQQHLGTKRLSSKYSFWELQPIILEVCLLQARLPDQAEPRDEALLIQFQEESHLQAFVLLGDFSPPDICWESSRVSCRQSRRFLECMDDNFLTSLVKQRTWGEKEKLSSLEGGSGNLGELYGCSKVM